MLIAVVLCCISQACSHLYVCTMQALEDTLSNGTASLFTQQMTNRSVTAIASYADLRVFPGDSFYDQVLGYAGPAATHVDRVPVGLPVGVAVGGSIVLAATAILAFYIIRQRKQNREQRVWARSKSCAM